MLVPTKIQRTIVKIIRYYHPDKLDQNLDKEELADGSLSWFYEEITKQLNQILNHLRDKEKVAK